MIMHEDLYLDFIASRGVGVNDVVASSPASYISYLNSVAKLIDSDITPELLRSEADVSDVILRLEGTRAPQTIINYRSAMRQYVAMVDTKSL